MVITIHINEKLDLSRFRKQALGYIGRVRELNYHFYLPSYRVVVETAALDNSTAHMATIYITEIWRDSEKEIKREQSINPNTDTRFAESKVIQSIWTTSSYLHHNHKAQFISSSVAETADKICQVVKLVFKINNLKVFL